MAELQSPEGLQPRALIFRALRKQFHGLGRTAWVGHSTMASDCHSCNCATDAVLAEIEATGRLLPSGGEVKEQWAVRWVGYEDGTVEYSDEVYARYVYELYAPGGVYHVAGKEMELLRRDARTFDDGSYYVGPWVPVVSDNSEVPRG